MFVAIPATMLVSREWRQPAQPSQRLSPMTPTVTIFPVAIRRVADGGGRFVPDIVAAIVPLPMAGTSPPMAVKGWP